MILSLRVDHRLLHGQVAYSWTNYLNANCILVANDEVVNDDMRKTALYMAKPANCKLVMKGIQDSIDAINQGRTEQYRLFIIVESIADALRIIRGCNSIKKLNLGNVKQRENTRILDRTFSVTKEEEKQLNELLDEGYDIFIQRVPDMKAIAYTKG